MAALKPVYLIHGDDHGAVAERRANLKALAEQQGGAAGVEILSGESASPEGAALALSAMTFAIGWRVVIVDGVERFKQAEVERHLLPAIAAMPPETTLALFAREEGRFKAPSALHAAVKKAGGQIVSQETIKPWELPKWVRGQAQRIGISLDAAAAKTLVAIVGERQQRLLRELEKLALELDAGSGGTGAGGSAAGPEGAGDGAKGARPKAVSAEEIEARAARSSQRRAFTLADALVAGDAGAALSTYLALSRQGERLAGLTYQLASRLREAVAVSARLHAGESAGDVRRSLRMPPKAAERFVADVARADQERLKEGLCVLADLELDLRGGGRTIATRRLQAQLSEETVAVRAIEAIAGRPA